MSYLENTMINKELVLDFFLVLSRMEFALKLTGYATGSNKKVSPDWDKFAIDIKDLFKKERDPDLRNSCEYYLKYPPKKQILVNDTLDWRAATPRGKSEPEKLLIYVRRVRNNLFHGGKYNDQNYDETARNERLLEAGIRIIEEAMEQVPKVKAAYDGAAI